MEPSGTAPTRSLLPSAIALVAANVVPLVGVLFLDWKVFPIVLLFWAENFIIGVFNVIKMLSSIPGHPAMWILKVFLVPFFMVHYGIFTMVHGLFVLLLFGGHIDKFKGIPGLDVFWGHIREEGLIWAAIGLAASHAFSFFTNYIGRGEYQRLSPMELMKQPYPRVMVLHATILGGAGLLVLLKSPKPGLVLLIVLKVALDLRAHLREHRKVPVPREQPEPVPTA